MSIVPAFKSIRRILINKNVNRISSLIKYVIWQFRKGFNIFPCKAQISNSFVMYKDKIRANYGGTLLYTQGMYDYNNMNSVKYFLNNGLKVFFDIGANIGVYSLLASEVPSATVYSFEPHPFTFNLLKENIYRNFRKNILPFNLAVGEISTIVNFTDMPGNTTNKIIYSIDSDNVIKTKCISLNDFCKQNSVIPDVVKIDVEGLEYDVLRGSMEFLKDVKVLFIEISNNEYEIIALLTENGFDGPFYSIFNEKKLSRTRIKSSEDPIFISNQYISKLKTECFFSIK